MICTRKNQLKKATPLENQKIAQPEYSSVFLNMLIFNRPFTIIHVHFTKKTVGPTKTTTTKNDEVFTLDNEPVIYDWQLSVKIYPHSFFHFTALIFVFIPTVLIPFQPYSFIYRIVLKARVRFFFFRFSFSIYLFDSLTEFLSPTHPPPP